MIYTTNQGARVATGAYGTVFEFDLANNGLSTCGSRRLRGFDRVAVAPILGTGVTAIGTPFKSHADLLNLPVTGNHAEVAYQFVPGNNRLLVFIPSSFVGDNHRILLTWYGFPVEPEDDTDEMDIPEDGFRLLYAKAVEIAYLELNKQVPKNIRIMLQRELNCHDCDACMNPKRDNVPCQKTHTISSCKSLG